MPTQVRVVVRLPWNRPEQPLVDPPRIEWTSEKADILWKVIERSRTSDNGGTDWKGLAAHLQVPLPYLLYRVHARFQEELRGLQDIPGVLSPSSLTCVNSKSPEPSPLTESPRVPMRALGRGSARLSGSGRLSTPTGIRARLTSIGSNYSRRASSSTLTVQGPQQPPQPPSHSPPESESDSDEEDIKEEEAEKQAEEQDALDRKLKELQSMMTNEALGLVSSGLKTKVVRRGRLGPTSPASDAEGSRRGNLSRSESQSLSSTSSPQGSIPEIPSPAPDSQPHSPMRRHMSPHKSSSPPALSPRSAVGQWYGPLRTNMSEQGSNQGSEASSFSDISDASLSASALESALMSNINASRFSAIARSRFGGNRRNPH